MDVKDKIVNLDGLHAAKKLIKDEIRKEIEKEIQKNIPTKVSQLTNDSDFITWTYFKTHPDETKQNSIKHLSLSGTSGDLEDEEVELLREDKNNYILLDNKDKLYLVSVYDGFIHYAGIGIAESGEAESIKLISIDCYNHQWILKTKTIPTKTSQLTNDSGFITNSYHDTSKLDASKCTLQTTAPTSAITDDGIHIVYLNTEPDTKYAGYIYLIKD